MIQAIDHINLVVSDLENSVKFYTKLLGFKEVKRAHLEGNWVEKITGIEGVQADVVYILAPDGEPRFELLRYITPKGECIPANSLPNTVGLRHIALRTANIHSVIERLKEAGVEILGEPVTVPANVITHDTGHKVLCYFLDPDGILLELTEYKK